MSCPTPYPYPVAVAVAVAAVAVVAWYCTPLVHPPYATAHSEQEWMGKIVGESAEYDYKYNEMNVRIVLNKRNGSPVPVEVTESFWTE